MSGSEPQLSVLVLCDNNRSHASTVLEHLAALRNYSRHRVVLYNARGVPRSRFLDLQAFDVVVVHYSLAITSDNYVAPWLRDRLRAFDGLKVQFLQDEYRWVDDVTATMRSVGIDVLFSIVPERAVDDVYGGRLDGVEIVPTLAGFVPESLVAGRTVPQLAQRPIDVGYRGRVLPYWIGALSQEKVTIAKEFLARAPAYGLACDIAWGEADRIYGEDWSRFLSSCRTTLGAESGASITDFDGSIERQTLAYLDGRPDASFEEVFDAVLAPYEGNVMMNVISPRVFEAAALKTAMVMFPGEYGGVVEAGRHYVPLAKDFSNIEEVVSVIADVPALTEMTERTFEEIIAPGTYSLRTFVAGFDDVLSERAEPRGGNAGRSYALARVERPLVTRSIAGHDLLQERDERRRRLVALRLIRRNAHLRRLALRFLADADLRSRFGVRAALGGDLLRLGILLAEQCGEDVARERFVVTPLVEDRTTLTLMATLPEERPAASPEPTQAMSPLEQPDPPTILWNHTALGPLVYLHLDDRRDVGLQVGYHRLIGVYHFALLGAMAGKYPELVREVLRPLLAEPAAVEADTAADATAHRRPGRIRSRLRRRGALQLAAAIVASCAGRTGRTVVSRWLLRARREVTPRELLADLVKLDALRAACEGRIAGIERIAARVDGEELLYVSDDPVDGSAQPPAAPTLVSWDHSRVGTDVAFRGVGLSLGRDGVHRFEALQRVLADAPPGTWHALLPKPDQAGAARLDGTVAGA